MRLSRRGNGIKEVHILGGREGDSQIIGSCGGGKRCEECLLYALVCRTPSRFWLERRDVLRWMRCVGMLRRGERRESDWKGAKRPGTPNLRGGMRRALGMQ